MAKVEEVELWVHEGADGKAVVAAALFLWLGAVRSPISCGDMRAVSDMSSMFSVEVKVQQSPVSSDGWFWILWTIYVVRASP